MQAEAAAGKPALPRLPAFRDGDGVETLTLTLRDVFGLEVQLRYTVYEAEDLITRTAVYTNTSSLPLTLHKAASLCLDFAPGPMDLITLNGTWAAERTPERAPLRWGIQSIGSTRGIPGHAHNPAAILCTPDCTETAGSCWGFALVYSGNFLIEAQRADAGQRLVMGIHPYHFHWQLEPGASFAGPEVAGELCRMQELTGADTVIFCPGAVQTGPFVEEIDFTGRHTTSDEELLAMTQLAHDRGMRVFWKPAVNCLDGTWRARISFFDQDVPCETKWSGWFASYQAFQLHFAALAQQAGADMLILGCEMTQAERREAEWRRLIAAVRSVYAGAVSYNCDKYGEEHVSWWDALDVIASSGYYPIGQIDQNLDRIEPVVQHFQKPFFFAEAGCMQVSGAAAIPNNWELQGAPDPEEQARWYNALLTACQARPWFDGTAFWDWPLPAHAAADRYAFIQGPALDRIRAFYCAGK